MLLLGRSWCLRCVAIVSLLSLVVWNECGIVDAAAVTEEKSSSYQSFLKNRTSYMNIQIPTLLHMKSGYNHSLAQFGSHWNWWSPSGEMAQRLLYDPSYSKLCHTPKEDGAHNDTDSVVQKYGPHPFALLVDRGDCTFVEKVRRGQHLGASAVIIVNNQCLCNEVNCKEEQGEEQGEQSFIYDEDGKPLNGNNCVDDLPIVADDGSGGDITIPSILITKTAGEEIKNVLSATGKNNNDDDPVGGGIVVVELKWHLPKFESKVRVDLFHTPASGDTSEFLHQFAELTPALGNQLDFYPHYVIMDGSKLGCIGKSTQKDDPCYELCTNNGRYCSISHHNGHITGHQVVVESLRRMCLWNHVDDTAEEKKHHDHSHPHYWKYLEHFYEFCQKSSDDGSYFANKDCIKDAYKHAGITDAGKIDSCMKDSGDIDSDQTNAMLEEALHTAKAYGISSTPTIYFNGLPMTIFNLSPRTVLEGICMGFDSGMAPHVCYACGTCGDPVACAKRNPMKCYADDGKDHENPNKNGSSSEGKKRKRHPFRWLFFFALFGGAGGYIYYKKFIEDEDGGIGYSLTEAFMSDNSA